MRTVDPAKHEAQRQAILAAAALCFARNGFHKTSTEAICDTAGTSSGKLFHYFPNKKAIVLAVIEDRLRQHRVWMTSLQRQGGLAALGAFIDGVLDAAADPKERALALEIVAEAGRDVQVAAINAAGDRMLAEGLTTILAKACADEESEPVVGIDHVVRLLMAVVDGLFSRAAMDESFDPTAERRSLRAILRTILGIDANGDRE